jgi:hypothetical protein
MNEGLKVWLLVLGFGFAFGGVFSKVGFFPEIGGSFSTRGGMARRLSLTINTGLWMLQLEHRAMGGFFLHRGGERGLDRGEMVVGSGLVLERSGGES